MPLVINTPDGIYNDAFNSSWNASGINPALFGSSQTWQDDSWLPPLALEGPAAGVAWRRRSFAGSRCFSFGPTMSRLLPSGATSLNVNTLTGASWYVLNTAANALPVDGRWLIAQITTTGAISGTINYQIFPLGVGANQIQKSVDFDGAGDFPDFVTVCGCMDDRGLQLQCRGQQRRRFLRLRWTSAACVVVTASPKVFATATATCCDDCGVCRMVRTNLVATDMDATMPACERCRALRLTATAWTTCGVC